MNREQKEALGRMMVEGIKASDLDMVTGCLRRGGDPNVSVESEKGGQRRPVIHWAAGDNFNEKIAQVLLDNGADIETRDGDGETPLFYAIRNRALKAIAFLVRNGADPVAQNNGGTVALDVARTLSRRWTGDDSRENVMKALTKDYGPLPEKAQAAPAEAPPSVPGATEDDIQIMKPVEFRPKKGPGSGFNL